MSDFQYLSGNRELSYDSKQIYELSSTPTSPSNRSTINDIHGSYDKDTKGSRNRSYVFRRSGDIDDIISTCTKKLEVF